MKGTGNSQRFQSSSALASSKSNSTQTSVKDFQDFQYFVDVVIGGQPFSVMMDTGSSDLWVSPGDAKIKLNRNPLGPTNVTEAYGIGVAIGPVEFAELQFAGFTVPNQAFILAKSAAGFGFPEGTSGILGLSFEDSAINFAAQDVSNNSKTTVCATPIFNILLNNPDIPNSFDILLDRTSDLDDTSLGTLVIGSHLEGFEDITKQPRLPRVFDGRWSIATDAMHVNGKSFPFGPSSISSLKKGQFAAVLDTGFTFPPLPPAAVDFIYSSIPGAAFAGSNNPSALGQWYVLCMATVNVTFTLGGKMFPVHPLDLTVVDTSVISSDGNSTNVTVCYNTYQYLDLSLDDFSGFDAVLGDAFLRNVYASFDYGHISSTGEQSFIQLISTTDLEAAIPDFVASRSQALRSLPPQIDPLRYVRALNNTSSATSSTEDNTSSTEGVSGAVDNTSSPSSSPVSAASARI